MAHLAILVAASLALGAQPLTYPKTRTVSHVDTYHGIQVPDPYRWLEDFASPEADAWVAEQNKLSFGYLGAIEGRQAIRDRIAGILNYPRQSMPGVEGGRYFYTTNTGTQDQDVLVWSESLGGKPKVLIDPNTLSKDGSISVAQTHLSHDGKLMAYSYSQGGSDWREFRIKDVATGKDLPDVIRWSKFGEIVWSKDNSGFYYSRYPEPKPGQEMAAANLNKAIYYHKLGTPQSEDLPIYENPQQPTWFSSVSLSEDGRFLTLYESSLDSTNVMVYVKDLSKESHGFRPLFPKNDAIYSILGNDGETLYVQTNLDAPRYRIVKVRIDQPGPEHWVTVVPESKDLLESAALFGDRLFVSKMVDATSRTLIFDLEGKQLGEVQFPGPGTVSGFAGRRDASETFYTYTDMVTPTSVFRYDLKSGESSLVFKPEIDVDLSRFETKQVFYEAADGTRIPMFIAHKKGIELDGSNPTLLYGYGGFNSPQRPGYSSVRTVWLEMGGVMAIACVRGGGEYGTEWHDAGRKLRKQTTHEDFIAAAEWLQDQGYTSPAKTAVMGGSQGGMLVGSVITQRPELFGAALPQVGVMDMLRFNLFTIGYAWESDYGSPQNEAEFFALLGYSPYHNIRKGIEYPATLVMTADRDDRVVPAHSYKFAARMQAAQSGDSPILLRVSVQAGHGMSAALSKVFEEYADMWAFLKENLDFELPEGFGE